MDSVILNIFKMNIIPHSNARNIYMCFNSIVFQPVLSSCHFIFAFWVILFFLSCLNAFFVALYIVSYLCLFLEALSGDSPYYRLNG